MVNKKKKANLNFKNKTKFGRRIEPTTILSLQAYAGSINSDLRQQVENLYYFQ